MKKVICFLLMFSILGMQLEGASSSGLSTMDRTVEASSLSAGGILGFVDPYWILKEPLWQEILSYFFLFKDLLGDAYDYWHMLKGIANFFSHPFDFLHIWAQDWLTNCTPQIQLPDYFDTFLDFVSGKSPFVCCDKGIMDFLLNDLAGGPIHWFDPKTGEIVVSPTNNFYATQRYEAAKALTSLGPNRAELKKATEKGKEIQERVYTDDQNAAAATLEAMDGLLKVEAIRMDFKSSDVMLAALERQKKLRGQTFLEMSNSAAIVGIFGVNSSSGSAAANSTGTAGYQNLFE